MYACTIVCRYVCACNYLNIYIYTYMYRERHHGISPIVTHSTHFISFFVISNSLLCVCIFAYTSILYIDMYITIWHVVFVKQCSMTVISSLLYSKIFRFLQFYLSTMVEGVKICTSVTEL